MRYPVHFSSHDRTAWVESGSTVSEAAERAGVDLPAECGRRALCGKCAVRVIAGELAEPGATERAALKRAPEGVRLACRARVVGPVTIRPLVDSALRPIASCSNEGRTVVASVDLGTTSVSAVVIDPVSGSEIGRATVGNEQRAFGADVLSRVTSALEGRASELQRAAWESVHAALTAACAGARISRLVIAGNTTMAALLAGSDVSTLAAAPFSVPESLTITDSTFLNGLMTEGGIVELVSPIAPFVGGDILCGVSLLLRAAPTGASCLVDIGTNAEVAVLVGGRLTVASAPAGPAFEGWGISSGGPAVPGAVSSALIRQTSGDTDVVLSVIGDVEARWFSGAGLVSAIGALRSLGHIDDEGLMRSEGPLAPRFDRDGSGVLRVNLSDTDTPLWISQLDVRSFQLAKAAVRVAVEIALQDAGITAADLGALWVSGAFGAALDAGDLTELGIVPAGAASVLRPSGNTSLEGAAAYALDAGVLDEAAERAASAVSIDLAARPDFGARLIGALVLAPYEV